MVLNRNNIDDIYDRSMFELAKELNVEKLGIVPSVIASGNATNNLEDFLTTEQILQVSDFVNKMELDDSYPEITISAPPAIAPELSLANTDLNRPRCKRGINSFAVRPDGEIVVCSDFAELGYEEYTYGNIFSGDIKTILENAKRIQESIMSRHSQVKGICSICTALPQCGGACRADAYAYYNDILAPIHRAKDYIIMGYFHHI